MKRCEKCKHAEFISPDCEILCHNPRFISEFAEEGHVGAAPCYREWANAGNRVQWHPGEIYA